MEGSHSGLVRRPGKSVCLKGHREFESLTLRQKTKSGSDAKIWSARSADTNEFPPPNSESKRVFHAPRGSSFANTKI